MQDHLRTARLTHRAAGRRRLAVGWSRLHARVLRLSRGRLLPRWFGAPVLVLETVGRRSGQPRATPVLYARLDDAFVVMPASAGSDRTPAWWLNLRAAGRGTVLVGGRRLDVVPRVLEGAERDAARAALLAVYPAAEHYEGFTARAIPFVALERAGD